LGGQALECFANRAAADLQVASQIALDQPLAGKPSSQHDAVGDRLRDAVRGTRPVIVRSGFVRSGLGGRAWGLSLCHRLHEPIILFSSGTRRTCLPSVLYNNIGATRYPAPLRCTQAVPIL